MKYDKKLILLFSFYSLINLYSCSPGLIYVGAKESKHGSTVEVIEKAATSRVEYKSYKVLYNELQSKATLQMWDKNRIETETNQLPSGGYIIVNITGITIDAANTEWWEYVIQTIDGQEIKREKGKRNTPQFTTSQYGTTWWNIDLVSLDDKVEEPFQVYVIDKLQNRRDAFKVYPNRIIK